MAALRKLLKKPLLFALKNEWLRGKIVYELRKDFFRNLQVSVPLGNGLACPLFKHDYVHSFSEIFVAGEYSEFLGEMPLPRRWIDLGCHAGFFSLYLAWQWRKAGDEDFSALLVDADPRVRGDVTQLIEMNSLQKQFQFRAGMIAKEKGEAPFAMREAMGSSGNLGTHAEGLARVAVISAEEILAVYSPPYDLLKVDIEGGEFDLLESYEALISKAANLLIEWHSWDVSGSAEVRMREALGRSDFQLVKVLQERKHFRVEGKDLTTGCHLYRNAAIQDGRSNEVRRAVA